MTLIFVSLNIIDNTYTFVENCTFFFHGKMMDINKMCDITIKYTKMK